MKMPPLSTRLSLGIDFATVALAAFVGCSSRSSSGPSSGCQGTATACQNWSTSVDSGALPDVATGTDTGSESDAGTESDVVGDGAMDGAAPSSLYGACAVKGSFGWPCSLTTSAADPADCTDTNYGECFAGGQGAWCTKLCSTATDCTTAGEDAGCAPTGCNARGYCK